MHGSFVPRTNPIARFAGLRLAMPRVDLCRGAVTTYLQHVVVPNSELLPAPFQPFLAHAQPLRTLVNSDFSMLPVLLQPSFLSHRAPRIHLCLHCVGSCVYHALTETKLMHSFVLSSVVAFILKKSLKICLLVC